MIYEAKTLVTHADVTPGDQTYPIGTVIGSVTDPRGEEQVLLRWRHGVLSWEPAANLQSLAELDRKVADELTQLAQEMGVYRDRG